MSINDFNALVSELEFLAIELKAKVDFSSEFNKYEQDPSVEITDANFIWATIEGVMNGLTLLDKCIGEYIEAELNSIGENGKKEGVQ